MLPSFQVTVSAEYAKYSLSPTSLNFGPLVYGSSTTRSFVINNTGQVNLYLTLVFLLF